MKASKLMTTVLVAGMLAGCASHKYSVYFTPGSSALSADSKRIIKEAALMAKRKNAGEIKISGYTDTVGTKTMNKNLASKRVDAVDKLMERFGINESTVVRAAHGKHWFYTKDMDEQPDASLRRVDIRIYKY